MKVTTWTGWILLSLLLGGCATSTVESRKQERYGAYAALSPELRSTVDQGQIKVGMSMDAGYIAWGKPAQVLTSESSKGKITTWLYHGTQLHEYRYWTYHNYLYQERCWSQPYLATDYYPQRYIRAEIVFENGEVKQWRTLPAPLP